MVCLVRKMDGIEPAADDGDPVPNYLRTRQVIVREVVIENKVYVLVTCGCHYFTRKKGPCHHFYAIVSREPSVEDFSPECLQSYELLYDLMIRSRVSSGVFNKVRDLYTSF